MKDNTIILFSRTILFYLVLSIWTCLWTSFFILVGLAIPPQKRHAIIVSPWAKVAVFICKIICGITFEIKGKENIPKDSCVIISNHQSAWETFFLQTLISPQSQVIKRELLFIPFFGWAFCLVQPIAIDRSNRRQSMKQILKKGSSLLKKGYCVLIFPEGTRKPSGHLGKFSTGGAVLAVNSGKKILPIAHNAGDCWPPKSFIKRPGHITIHIGKPIPTAGREYKTINDECRQWIFSALDSTRNESEAA
ncbi:lysophospholipid acyltransferase family protein [Zooshikella sp. RANM57]|uniref:lysophospholipid acyltransferase family protein n=1 Tax=Zooshikella sp. RANM57 TaxID=3425863 RepID=UPI003D6DB8D5